MKRCGVYRLIVGDLHYYGSSVDIDRRYRDHLRNLSRGTHHNYKLQRVYREDTPVFLTVLRLCERPELRKVEQEYLDQHWGKRYCANIARDAEDCNRGVPHGAKHKFRISESLKVPVFVRWRSGKTSRYESCTRAAETLGVCPTLFSKWLNGHARITHPGVKCIWRRGGRRVWRRKR